jgi:hypothetical protein
MAAPLRGGRAINRIVEAIGAGTIAESEVRARMADLRRRREAAEADLTVLAPPAKVALHPAAITRYLASVEDLAGTMSRRIVDGDEQAAALRELVVAVVVHPAAGEPVIEVSGRLAKLTGTDLFPQRMLRTVVAEDGFEPPTHGL